MAPTTAGKGQKGAGGGAQLEERGWGEHPPARLSHQGCLGHPAAQDLRHSLGQGCHPAGERDRSGARASSAPAAQPSTPEATSAPQSPGCSCNRSCPIHAAPWGPGSQAGVAAKPQGQGAGAGWRLGGSLTRASSDLWNWAKHWKKTQESPRGPLQGSTGGAVGHSLLQPASAPSLSWRTPDRQVGAVHGSLPGCRAGPACPECAQSVPSPASTCCFATRADARGVESSSAHPPKTHQDQRFWYSHLEVGKHSHGRSSRCQGLPACPRPPSPP